MTKLQLSTAQVRTLRYISSHPWCYPDGCGARQMATVKVLHGLGLISHQPAFRAFEYGMPIAITAAGTHALFRVEAGDPMVAVR